MNKVHELNSAARRLLAFLHDWHLKAQGRPFSIGPCEETFQNCSLDADAYRGAAGRLVTKDLAEWFGAGGLIFPIFHPAPPTRDGLWVAVQNVRTFVHEAA